MKKVIISSVLVIAVLSIAGYFACQTFSTDLAAEVLAQGTAIDYIPKRIQARIQSIKAPLNDGTEAVLKEIHSSGVSLEEILVVIDNTTEEQAYALVDELNTTRPKNTDQVFDILKEHIDTNFDPEIFRAPFTSHVNMKQVRRLLFYVNQNRKTHDVEFGTGKAIIKKILIDKESELRARKADRNP